MCYVYRKVKVRVDYFLFRIGIAFSGLKMVLIFGHLDRVRNRIIGVRRCLVR